MTGGRGLRRDHARPAVTLFLKLCSFFEASGVSTERRSITLWVLDAAAELRFLFQAAPALCISLGLYFCLSQSPFHPCLPVYDSFSASASPISVSHCFCLSPSLSLCLPLPGWLASALSICLSSSPTSCTTSPSSPPPPPHSYPPSCTGQQAQIFLSLIRNCPTSFGYDILPQNHRNPHRAWGLG